MSELWDKFITGFCKVEFACWNGEPNWLGWVFIGGVLCAFFVPVIEWWIDRSSPKDDAEWNRQLQEKVDAAKQEMARRAEQSKRDKAGHEAMKRNEKGRQ